MFLSLDLSNGSESEIKSLNRHKRKDKVNSKPESHRGSSSRGVLHPSRFKALGTSTYCIGISISMSVFLERLSM